MAACGTTPHGTQSFWDTSAIASSRSTFGVKIQGRPLLDVNLISFVDSETFSVGERNASKWFVGNIAFLVKKKNHTKIMLMLLISLLTFN